MKSKQNNSNLYRYFLFYFIIQIASFMFIYALFTNLDSDNELRRIVMVPLLLAIFVSTNIFILYLLKKVFIVSRKQEKSNIELLKYKYLETDLILYRQHRHDMKNHLMIMYELVKNKQYTELEDYTKQYLDSTSNKLYNVNTGLDELDVLIYNKFELSKSKNITIEYNCNTEITAHYNSTIDLISIFSNLLDNAIDANEKISNPNDRMISINIYEDQLDFIFVVTNAFVEHKKISSAIFSTDGITTKSDIKNHGLGLGIVGKLVSKYNGNISFDVFNDIFYQVKIEIPKHIL